MNNPSFHMKDLISNDNVTAQRTNSNCLLVVAEKSVQLLSLHLLNESPPQNKAFAAPKLKRSPSDLIPGPGAGFNESGHA